MNVGKTLFAQIMDFVPWTSFSRIVDRHAGNAGVRRMTSLLQILSVSIFEKVPLNKAFFDTGDRTELDASGNQLNLFNY
jgi:hypothetical protein